MSKVIIRHVSNQLLIECLVSDIPSDEQIEVSLGIPDSIIFARLIEVNDSVDNALQLSDIVALHVNPCGVNTSVWQSLLSNVNGECNQGHIDCVG